MRLGIISLGLVVALSGCASSIEKIAGSGQITNKIDDFTSERVIEMSTTPNYDLDGNVATTFFGAKWSDSNPESVTLRLVSKSSVQESDTYVTFETMDVNISGEIKEFKAAATSHDSGGYNDVSNTIYTESNSYVRIPKSYLGEMLESENTKIRIYTGKFYEDLDFQRATNSIGVRNSKPVLKVFLKEINTAN